MVDWFCDSALLAAAESKDVTPKSLALIQFGLIGGNHGKQEANSNFRCNYRESAKALKQTPLLY